MQHDDSLPDPNAKNIAPPDLPARPDEHTKPFGFDFDGDGDSSAKPRKGIKPFGFDLDGDGEEPASGSESG